MTEDNTRLHQFKTIGGLLDALADALANRNANRDEDLAGYWANWLEMHAEWIRELAEVKDDG